MIPYAFSVFGRPLRFRALCKGLAAHTGRIQEFACEHAYVSETFTKFATDTCGQLRVLKFSRTRCEYCSICPGFPCASTKSEIQNVASICAASAFGLPATPVRKAMLDVPPPEVGGFR